MYPSKQKSQEKTSQRYFYPANLPPLPLSNHWKAALLTKSSVSWEKLVRVLIILLSADGFIVASFVFLVLKDSNKQEAERTQEKPCVIIARGVFAVNRLPCLGKNLLWSFLLAVVRAAGGSN